MIRLLTAVRAFFYRDRCPEACSEMHTYRRLCAAR